MRRVSGSGSPKFEDFDVEVPERPPVLTSIHSTMTFVSAIPQNASSEALGSRVLFVTTQGGHLAHLIALQGWWRDRDRLWVAPSTPDVTDRLEGERVVQSYSPTTRNVPNLIRNAALAVRVLRRERPAIVVSAGAGVAVPFFVAAWFMRIPTVFIEVYDRVDSPTVTGRLCGPFTTRRIVQWQSQLDFYPDASLVGPLL